MKREKRVIACLLAIIMMITAVPDMHLWADEGTTETGSEWLSFESKNTKNGVEVTINKGTELKRDEITIKYQVLVNGEVEGNDKEYQEYEKEIALKRTAGENKKYQIQAYAVFRRTFETTPDTNAPLKLSDSLYIKYDPDSVADQNPWKVYDEKDTEVSEWKVKGVEKNSIEITTPVIASDIISLNGIIDSVELTDITQPVAGEKLDTTVKVPENAGYTASKITWSSDDEATGEVAEYETTYTAKVVLEANADYQFGESASDNILINKKKINNLLISLSDDKKTLTISWNSKTEDKTIIKDSIIVQIKKPIVGEKLSTDVSVTAEGIKSSKLEWKNGNGIVQPSTKYKATITLELKNEYKFDKEKSKISIKLSDESDITEEVKNNISYENGNIIIKWEYTTESMITSITPPSDITVANGTPLEVIKQKLPTTVTANADGNNKELHVTWNTVNTSYDQNVKTAQSFEITGTVDVDKDKYVIVDGVNLSVTIRIIVSAVNDTTAPVITGIENGKIYCQSKTFTVFDENLKSVTINGIDQGKNGSYTLAAGASYTIIATDVLDHTTTVTIVINQGHAWDSGKITQNATDKKEGIYTYSCTHCDSKKQSIIPRKSITVEWGKKLKLSDLISDTTGFEKVTVSNASKYKKYFAVDSKKGIVKTTVTAKTKIKKSIPVKLVLIGKTYTVDVKIKIPAPKVTISKKDLGNSYRYTFKYNIKGATKIKVRCKEINANTLFDKYLSKSKSNKDSYVICAKNKMKKYKNKLTFTITAYYGKNISKTYKIRK